MTNQNAHIFAEILTKQVIDIETLKKNSFCGIPAAHRPKTYLVLLNIVNLINSQYEATLTYKNEEYKKIPTIIDIKIQSQIALDVQRIEPQKKIIVNRDYSSMMITILLKYACERPSVGYVQGMSDILCVFISIFCNEEYVESNVFYCFSRFMDNIQSNYVNFQRNIFKLMERMQMVVEILEPALKRHLSNLNLEVHFFAFRWFNCVFVREFRMEVVLLLMDSIVSTNIKYNDFMVFFGASFLISMKQSIIDNDFTDVMHKLQEVNRDISLKEMKLLLAKAFVNYNIFNERKE